MRAPRIRLTAAAALSLALALSAAAPRRAAAAEPLAWVAPSRARLVAWPAPAGADVDPRGPVVLGAGQLLLVPVDAGDRLALRGDVAAVGLGSGAGDAPDVVTWMPLPPPVGGVREIAVPAWSSARFLVVRGAAPQPGAAAPRDAEVAIRVAARESAPLVWYRLDEDVAAWLRDGAAPPVSVPAEAASLLRWIAAARDALAAAEPGRGGLPENAAAWLVARYVEESLRIRPLLEPYFVRRGVDAGGGRDAGELPPVENATAWRAAAARPARPDRMTVRAPGADVLRLALRARALGPARAVIRVGGAVVRELAFRPPSRLLSPSRWTDPQWIRVVLPVDAREATVEVIEGEVAVVAIGHRQRVGVADFFSAQRDREALLDEAARPGPPIGAGEIARRLAAAGRASAPAPTKAAMDHAGKPIVPSAARALMLAESVLWAPSPDAARARAARAWDAARGAPGPSAAVFQRAALERLAAAHVDPAPPPAPWSGWGAVAAMHPDVHADDAAALAALGEALSPPRDGRRPLAGAPAERWALGHGELDAAAPRARQAWAREAPWRGLEVEEGASVSSALAIPRDALPSGAAASDPDPRCAVVGPSGLRWTLLDAPRTQIDVDLGGAPGAGAPLPAGADPRLYARVLLRGASVEPEPESAVTIDGVPVAVHAGAGVASVVAIAPGARTFERPDRAPAVLARIPRAGSAPCASLREISPWVWVDGAARFTIPDLERATVARLVVAPSLGAQEGDGAPRAAAAPGSTFGAPGRLTAPSAPNPTSRDRVLRVSAGGVAYEAWVRPGATGAVEVPVPRGAGELHVETRAPTLLRASARLHPAPPPPPRPARPLEAAPPTSLEALLQVVRAATRALRGAVDPERSRLRRQRAAALDLLGFQALAALDRDPEPPRDEGAGAASTEALVIPPGSPAVVPLGMLARVPPLPLPAERAPLRDARDAHRAGDPRAGVDRLAGPAGGASGADALLLGLLAEQAGDPRIASDAYTRVGLAHRAGAALARAANLATDVAAADRGRVATLRAYALAELAVQAGEPPPGALARLAPVVAWRAPPRADQTAGTASLDVRAKADRDLPLRVRVRRALIDAPDDALLVTDGAHAEFRLDQPGDAVVVVESACRTLDAAAAPCALSLALDGAPVACPEPPAGEPARCAVPLSKGEHRIEARPPADRSVLAWTRATLDASRQPGRRARGRASGPLPGRVLSSWYDIDPDRPLELAFAGPTVVRIRARAAYECAAPRRNPGARAPAPGAEPDGDDAPCAPAVATTDAAGALRYAVTPLGAEGAAAAPIAPFGEGVLPLDKAEDRAARRLGVTREPYYWLGNEAEVRVAVLPEGAHLLRVASPAGRALLRVEIAVATGAPDPRAPGPAPPPPPPEHPVAEPLRAAPAVGLDPDTGPLTFGAYLRFVDGSVTEEDFRVATRHLEIGVDMHRELVERAAWIRVATFGRVRGGPPSFGTEASFDSASAGVVPAIALRGRAVLQPFPSFVALGGRAGLGVTWAIPVEDVTLAPFASVALLAIDEDLRGSAGADRDVYSPYAATHPTQAALGARVRVRPAVDALVSTSAALRLSPLPSTLDRIDLGADLDLLPGRDLFPWIQLGWLTSFRLANETRPEPFVRSGPTLGVTFWRWFLRGHRASLGGETSFWFDVPDLAQSTPRLSAILFARYDYTAGRGLRDFPPHATPFRDRMEEGSGRVERAPPAVDPAWEDGAD